MRDVATLVGAPANAGGTVAYKVYTDSNCTNLFATPGAKAVGAGNVAAASDWVKFTTSGTYYWIANYKGNGNVAGVTSACGDEVVTVRVGAEPLTPGYWKNHQQQATPLLPIKLGNYNVSTFALATGVFNNMNCSSSSANGAIGCLSGHLLATKFNLKNGSDSCIQGVVDKADAFLKAQSVTYGGYTATGVNYTGPSATYTLSATQRSLAIALKDALDKYNNGGGC